MPIWCLGRGCQKIDRWFIYHILRESVPFEFETEIQSVCVWGGEAGVKSSTESRAIWWIFILCYHIALIF